MRKGTLVGLLDNAVEKYRGRIAIKSQVTGEKWTYEQLRENSRRVAGTLLGQGVHKGDRIAIISNNNPGFVAADLGTLMCGGISVPIDQELRPENLLRDYFELVKPTLVLVDPAYESKAKKYSDAPVITICSALQGSPLIPEVEVMPDDLSTIIFSSGTSAVSERAFKAVMLSHDNLFSNIESTAELPSYVERVKGASQGVYLAGLAKQWHSFEYMIHKAFLNSGCLLYFSDVLRFRKGSAAQINPHYAIMIPKVANSIMKEIRRGISKKGPKTKEWFEWFMKKSSHYYLEKVNEGRIHPIEFFEHLVGDAVFYSQIRKKLRGKLGENDPFLIGGSAPLPLETQLFFYAIGLPIYQGYGLTETSPVISVNLPWAYRFRSSGKIIPGTEILIADQELLKKGIIREIAEGENGVILARGRNVFKGYFWDEERTRSALVGGWFNTEDKGHKEGEHLHVEGRVKRQTCTSDGEKHDDSTIESYCGGKGLEVIVVGEGCKHIGLLVIPDEEMKKHLANVQVAEEILTTLSGSKQDIGYEFNRRNILVVGDIDDHPTWKTGTTKLRTELIKQAYAERIKEICN